jgi:hypothetical protein
MKQRPSWEANTSSATQEILRILCNLKVHYRIHNSPPPVPILNQINPAYAPHPTSLRSTLILSSHLCLGLTSGLPPSGFPNKAPYVLHSQPNTFFFIWSPEWYFLRSEGHNVVCYVLFIRNKLQSINDFSRLPAQEVKITARQDTSFPDAAITHTE